MTLQSIDRRTWLRSAGTAALGFGLEGCAGRAYRVSPRSAPRRFASVKVAWERIIRTIVGLRPFRPSGFVLRAERMGDKTIIHNYGHGGGGVTLCWGTAHLAVEEALRIGQGPAAVIGCGAVGLATARLLQRQGAPVSIYARELPPETTSNVAGAQWSPHLVFDPERSTPEFQHQLERATRLSHRYFQDLVGDHYGVHWIENYALSDEPFAQSDARTRFRELYPDAKELRPGEHPFPARYARRFVTMFIEPPVYLNAVMRDFLLAGGRLVVRSFETPEELLSLPEPVIMNCTGMGARALFGDEELTPVKGQLTVLLPQPEVDYIVLKDDLYMFPRRDGILLGGTHEHGVWSLKPNEEEERRIVEGHIRLFNGMR